MDPVSLTLAGMGVADAAGGAAAASAGTAATVGSVGSWATLAGSAVSAVGSLFSGSAKAAAATYQSAIALTNAKIAQRNASYEIAKGESDAQRIGMQTRYQMGITKTTQAASGIDVNRGTPVNVRMSEASIGSLNEALTRVGAQRKAYNFNVEAMTDTAQSQLDQMQASAAKTEGDIGAMSSIMGGIGSVSSKWLQGRNVGLGGGSGASSGGDLSNNYASNNWGNDAALYGGG